ncbi:hypothetical protein FH972_026387 [Carpinus fangiana]|uniref:Sphingolipid delta(4)-desaturase DES1-like n=1 Tax=Carpinus fangiana TaxID=176857 RepID=A0A5N6L3S6_9ROSI|nr:hypothetical protein FH972_026387 [Carpinus fangiana]
MATAVSTATVTTRSRSSPRTKSSSSKTPSKGVATTSTTQTCNEASQIENDFFWTYTEEPHRTRRRAIIQAHPDVLKLCGPEPLTKYIVFGVVATQFVAAYLLRNSSFFSPAFLLTAYIVGATANQNLFLAIHEISHNLAFKSPALNRTLALLANLPIAIPYSASFRPYHLTHHKSLGVDGIDVDLPTSLEALFLNSVAGKTFFCTCQILFYALRPMFVLQLPLGPLHFANIAVQVAFDVALVKFFGWMPLAYLILSSFLAGSLHPCAGHFIAEHYVFEGAGTLRSHTTAKATADTKKQSQRTSASKSDKLPVKAPSPAETYSYYGPLNFFTYNVGYHNEHHDFPAVPWSRLPALHEAAREYYEDLPCHRSWCGVMWYFITDPKVGLWNRVKREAGSGGRLVGGLTRAEDNGE